MSERWSRKVMICGWIGLVSLLLGGALFAHATWFEGPDWVMLAGHALYWPGIVLHAGLWVCVRTKREPS